MIKQILNGVLQLQEKISELHNRYKTNSLFFQTFFLSKYRVSHRLVRKSLALSNSSV